MKVVRPGAHPVLADPLPDMDLTALRTQGRSRPGIKGPTESTMPFVAGLAQHRIELYLVGPLVYWKHSVKPLYNDILLPAYQAKCLCKTLREFLTNVPLASLLWTDAKEQGPVVLRQAVIRAKERLRRAYRRFGRA